MSTPCSVWLPLRKHIHFISCLHAPSGAAHEGRKLLLLCQLASPATYYAGYFGRSQLPGPRPQAAAAAGPQQRPHPNPTNPNQPEPTHPKATTPGRLRCVRGTQELRQNPNVTTTHPNGPPNTAPQPPRPPPTRPAQLPVTHSDDYIWEEAKLAITDHAAPPTLHRLAPSLQGWRTGLIRYNDLQPPAVSTSSFTTQATQHHSHGWPAKFTKSSTSAPHALPSLAASIHSPS